MSEEIRAEIAASVLRVSTSPGSVVVGGDTLGTLESMKMEIPIIVEVSGRVTNVAIAEGDIVRTGQVMFVVA